MHYGVVSHGMRPAWINRFEFGLRTYRYGIHRRDAKVARDLFVYLAECERLQLKPDARAIALVAEMLSGLGARQRQSLRQSVSYRGRGRPGGANAAPFVAALGAAKTGDPLSLVHLVSSLSATRQGDFFQAILPAARGRPHDTRGARARRVWIGRYVHKVLRAEQKLKTDPGEPLETALHRAAQKYFVAEITARRCLNEYRALQSAFAPRHRRPYP